MILDLLQPVFKKETLWRPVNGESILKSLFKQVKQDIIPCLESNLHLDFTGKFSTLWETGYISKMTERMMLCSRHAM